MRTPRSSREEIEGQEPFVLLGGGGHANVVAAALRSMRYSILGVADDSGVTPNGLTTLGPIKDLVDQFSPAEIKLANAIGDIPTREKIFDYFLALGYEFPPLVHPKSYVVDASKIAAGSQVMMGACVQAEAEVGENCIVNTGAIIEHDCKIHAHCHIAPGAVLCGNVELGKGVFIGAGAVVPPKMKISDGAFIKAGSVATRTDGVTG